MSNFEMAVKYDCNGQIKLALEFYMKSINSGENFVDAYSNSAVIHWQFAGDFGFRYGYSVDLSDIPGDSYLLCREILNQGIRKYPENKELKFWLYYIKLIDEGTTFSLIECEKFYAEDNLIPVLLLAQYSAKYEKKIKALCNQLKQSPTCKNKYAMGIICPRRIRKLP